MDTIEEHDLKVLIQKIERDRGLDCRKYRFSYVKRRVQSRLFGSQVKTFPEYLTLLDKSTEEYNRLIDTLTVNVTKFFRDKGVFKAFETRVAPKLVEAKSERKQAVIRVWSAGCSSGEETYSIAMILKEKIKDGTDWIVSVYGTDIDKQRLDRARKAVYPREALADIPPQYRAQYVISSNSSNDTFSIDPEIRSMTRFWYSDMFEPLHFKFLDMIFCRNVFIYFDREQQSELYNKFYQSLNVGGYLVIGSAEKLLGDKTELFKSIGSRCIYRKIGKSI